MIQHTDEYLVKEIKDKKDNDSLLELISRHSGIYVEMIRRYGQKHLTETQINDLMNEKDFNIYSAALEHDEAKSKFSTYLANRTKYNCLTNKTINKKNSKFVNFDDVEYEQEANQEIPCENSSKREFLKKVCFLLEQHEDYRVKEIFQERYFSADEKKLKPWKQIAKKMNLSIQGCIDIHNRTIEQLQKKIKNETITF
jgi:hypothetical protein